MKKSSKCFILFFMLLGLSVSGQTISYSLSTRDANCKGANNGRAEVNVVSTDPPYSYLWSTSDITSFTNDLLPGEYFVIVTDGSGDDTTINVTINEIPCLLSAAIVFTPNSDGFNDTWTISNIEYYPDHLVLVYNRWGQKVFEQRGEYEQWDGKDLVGKPVPDNSYYYIIYADKKDDSTIIKGSVSIIR